MKQIKFKQVDAFTSAPFAGNPAGVISKADDLTNEEMQKIAAEINLSETAFIQTPKSKEADFKVRFFTPLREVDLAGHPTIATFHALAEEAAIFLREPITTIKQETKAGVLPVELHIQQGKVKKVMMAQPKPTFAPFNEPLEDLATLLGIEVDEIAKSDLPVEIVSTGLPDLIVPVKHLSTVEQMKPEFYRLALFSEKIGVVSVHVFTFETITPISMVHTRDFAPVVGILEDPATGTANGALGAYLVKNIAVRGLSPITIIAEQGYAVNRPSEIIVEVHFSGTEVKAIKVGGNAITVIEGEIRF